MYSSNVMNSTDAIEFPLWIPLTTVNLFLFIGVLLPTTILMNVSVLVALIKSKVKHKPLLVLFGSLLIGVCIDKLFICVDQCVNSPASIRYCQLSLYKMDDSSIASTKSILHSVLNCSCDLLECRAASHNEREANWLQT